MYSGNGEDYKLGDTIGFGATSVVRLATYTPLNQLVAVKVMQLEQGRDSIASMQREVQLMSLSKHPNVSDVPEVGLRPTRLYPTRAPPLPDPASARGLVFRREALHSDSLHPQWFTLGHQ